MIRFYSTMVRNVERHSIKGDFKGHAIMLCHCLEKANVEKGNRVAVMFLFPTSFHGIVKAKVPAELRDFV